MRIISVALSCLAITLAVQAGMSPAHAETLEEDAARFAMRGSVLDVSLSPSGEWLAYIAPHGDRGEALFVVNVSNGGAPKAVLANSENDTDLGPCDWANDNYLVCNAYVIRKDEGLLVGFDRTYSIEASTGKIVVLTPRTTTRSLRVAQDGGSVVALDVTGGANEILMTRDYVKEENTNTRLANTKEGLGVDKVDVTDGKRRGVVPPDEDAERYIADQYGRVRIKVRHPVDGNGRLTGSRVYYYRTKQSDEWIRLSASGWGQAGGIGFVPVAVDSDADVAFGFGTKSGFDAIYSVPLDGETEPRLVLARDDADVDQLIRIGRQRRVIGASYATEKRQIAYLDPDFAKLSSQLQQALPGKPLVNIVDSSADERRLVLIASSDVDPGMIYLLDRDTMQMAELLPLRDQLVGKTMGTMRPVSFPASDGTQIPGYLTLPPGSDGKNLPAIVLPHGGPSARDEWGFDWLVQFFVARGFAVLQPNFRGSSGYGSDWFGRNGFQAWNIAIGDVNDGARWLKAEGIAAPGKLAIVGWSYGGYAALQSQALDPDLYKAVVAIAPVTDLAQLKRDSFGFTNFRIVADFIGSGPHVKAGSPAQNAGIFKAPVLLFHGTLDQNVDVAQSRLMAERLRDEGKAVTYVEFEGLDHQLDEAKARYRMLTEIAQFLSAGLGE